MPKSTCDPIASISIVNGSVTIEADKDTLAKLDGYKVNVRPLAMSVNDVPKMLDKVTDEMVKGANAIDELSIHRAKHKSAIDAVACLRSLDKDARSDAIAGLKSKDGDKYDKLVNWLVTQTGGKLVSDLIAPKA